MSGEAESPSADRDAPVAAIVLAAGASRRMGAECNKLVEPVGERPLVAWPVSALLEGGVPRIAVVVGHEAERIRAALSSFGRAVEFVICAEASKGMGHSIAAGVAHWVAVGPGPRDWTSLFVSVGDLPGLRPEVVRRLLAARRDEPNAEAIHDGIWVPTAAGRRGHPVLFGRGHAASLAALEGDIGARDLLVRAGAHVREVEIGASGIFRDVDTPEALARARGAASSDVGRSTDS